MTLPKPKVPEHHCRTVHPFKKFLLDLFAGPDGQTWAIGRVYSFPVLIMGLSIPIIALYKGQPVTLPEVGIGLSGVAGAVLLLVRGNNNVDISPPSSNKD